MNTFIVAIAFETGHGTPQIDLWAVRTSSRQKAEDMVRRNINIPSLSIRVASLDDAGKNALGLPDDFIKTI